jgi:hypothetical protein
MMLIVVAPKRILLAAHQADMAEAVVSWSRLRSRIVMIDSLALALGA